jgi:hypothetical protein
MIEDLRKALAELRREEPTTKSALVRQVFPEIEQALAEGYTVKSIWERCRGAGLETSYKDFCTYVNRARRHPGRSAAASGRKTSPNGLKSQANDSPGFDPLANIRRLEANRPGFHWRGTEDLDVLVHGKKKEKAE